MPEEAVITPVQIAPLVHVLRHEKVMLDTDLADLYGVEVRTLNQAVKRNLGPLSGRLHVPAYK